MQGQQSNQAKGRKHIPWKRLIIVAFAIIAIIVIGILNIQTSLVLATIGILVGLLQWLFPGPHTASHFVQKDNSAEQPAPSASGSSAISSKSAGRNYLTPIFLVNAPLIDPKFFYGRELERMQLLRRTRLGASTSIVGERRIGKTWLISYLKLIAPIELESIYRIGYLDVSSLSIKDVSSFTKKALEELGCSPALLGRSRIALEKLEHHLESLKQQNHKPVLCLDEFEWFKNNRQEFNLEFFTGLRAMTQAGLVLITASRKSLGDVLGDILGETSPFFNVFEMIKLRPFTATEARVFVKSNRAIAQFTEEECSRILKYGMEYGPDGEEQWPPLRLQLVAQLLFDDKSAGEKSPEHYRPNDQGYWQDFKKRLDEKYREVAAK